MVRRKIPARWTAEERQFLIFALNKASIPVIARALSRTYESVNSKRRRLGLEAIVKTSGLGAHKTGACQKMADRLSSSWLEHKWGIESGQSDSRSK